jgi:hypothetical protein
VASAVVTENEKVAAANAVATATRLDRRMTVLSVVAVDGFTNPCKLSHYQRFRPLLDGEVQAGPPQVTRL